MGFHKFFITFRVLSDELCYDNIYRLMFGHEGVGGILMWNFDNKVCCGTESNIVDSVSLEPNVAGDTYLK